MRRIRALAIPPAWTDVWICADPHDHLQATGRDARGRKQYRCHPEWTRRRGREKLARIIAFGAALPRLRRALRRSLAIPGFPREKVIAMVVAVLGATLIRIGNTEYASSNRSYGLTTLRDRHVSAMRGGGLRFRFRGKSGQWQDVTLTDARLARLVKRLRQLPGQLLFQYRDPDAAEHPVRSSDVNAWLHDTMGDGFSAKDFRTWAATTMAFRALATTELPADQDGQPPSERALAQVENAVIDEVAGVLGHSRAVCRSAYIEPSLFAAWRDGALARRAAGVRGERQWEAASLRFLRGIARGMRKRA